MLFERRKGEKLNKMEKKMLTIKIPETIEVKGKSQEGNEICEKLSFADFIKLNVLNHAHWGLSLKNMKCHKELKQLLEQMNVDNSIELSHDCWEILNKIVNEPTTVGSTGWATEIAEQILPYMEAIDSAQIDF